MDEGVLLEKKDGIATLLLNEPATLNALKPSMEDLLLSALRELEKDASTKVIVLAGNGRAFCAGGDISTMGNENTVIHMKRRMDHLAKIILALRQIEKPVIAAVHGYATGAGFSLALASDLIVAEKGAKFGLSFKHVGAIPDLGGHYFLPKAVGEWRAKEWIWTGAMISAIDGERLGFVNRLVQEGEGYEAAMELARELVKGPSLAYGYTKSIINHEEIERLHRALQMEAFGQSVLFQSQDHQEGIAAFREKRDPTFTGT
jgi:2-(1,2-epoxy-1,2-dihydrophenyl)acetyl-CoA isomerase